MEIRTIQYLTVLPALYCTFAAHSQAVPVAALISQLPWRVVRVSSRVIEYNMPKLWRRDVLVMRCYCDGEEATKEDCF